MSSTAHCGSTDYDDARFQTIHFLDQMGRDQEVRRVRLVDGDYCDHDDGDRQVATVSRRHHPRKTEFGQCLPPYLRRENNIPPDDVRHSDTNRESGMRTTRTMMRRSNATRSMTTARIRPASVDRTMYRYEICSGIRHVSQYRGQLDSPVTRQRMHLHGTEPDDSQEQVAECADERCVHDQCRCCQTDEVELDGRMH